MSYAIIRTGGKQYRVAPGETVRVERVDDRALRARLAREEV